MKSKSGYSLYADGVTDSRPRCDVSPTDAPHDSLPGRGREPPRVRPARAFPSARVMSARSHQRQTTRLFAEELEEELDEADKEELETRKEGEILAKKLRSNM